MGRRPAHRSELRDLAHRSTIQASKTLARYSFTGMSSRRQDSTADRIAATLGLLSTLPMLLSEPTNMTDESEAKSARPDLSLQYDSKKIAVHRSTTGSVTGVGTSASGTAKTEHRQPRLGAE